MLDRVQTCYSLTEDRIAIRKGMSQIQTVKTAIHEMAHQKMHCPHTPGQDDSKSAEFVMEQSEGADAASEEAGQEESAQEQQKTSRDTKEVQAESVAYTICRHYGIDTSDYSFAYIAAWSAIWEFSVRRR